MSSLASLVLNFAVWSTKTENGWIFEGFVGSGENRYRRVIVAQEVSREEECNGFGRCCV
jgi:hypothetical protein